MTENQKLAVMENLELAERHEMALRFQGKERQADQVLIERLRARNEALAELSAETEANQ